MFMMRMLVSTEIDFKENYATFTGFKCNNWLKDHEFGSKLNQGINQTEIGF